MSDTWRCVFGVDLGTKKVSVASASIRFKDDEFLIDNIAIHTWESVLNDYSLIWKEVREWLIPLIQSNLTTGEYRSHYLPGTAFVEEPPFVRNHRTHLYLSAMFGVIMGTFASELVEPIGIPVSSWKKTVIGNGNANKDLVRQAMIDKWPALAVNLLLQDEIDALALLTYGMETFRKEQLL